MPDEPCHFGDKAEPGSNAHDGNHNDKVTNHKRTALRHSSGKAEPGSNGGGIHNDQVSNHKRTVRRKCTHGVSIKDKRETNDVKDTIEDILSFYNEVDGLNDKNKFKRSQKESQTNKLDETEDSGRNSS